MVILSSIYLQLRTKMMTIILDLPKVETRTCFEGRSLEVCAF